MRLSRAAVKEMLFTAVPKRNDTLWEQKLFRSFGKSQKRVILQVKISDKYINTYAILNILMSVCFSYSKRVLLRLALSGMDRGNTILTKKPLINAVSQARQ